MKHWQSETPIKSNINCKKYTKNIKLYDIAEIFLKRNLKKIVTTHLDAGGVRWPRNKHFILR